MFLLCFCRLNGTLPKLSDEDDELPDARTSAIRNDNTFRLPNHVVIWKYATQALNVIDLIAIIPFYVSLIADSGSSLSIIRILRLARVIRLLRSGKGKFQKGLSVLSRTLVDSAPMCAFLLFIAMIVFVICGSIEYLLEGGVFRVTADTPDGAYYRRNLLSNAFELTPFESVLHGLYWSVVTSTTVGYGDMYPTSPGGRVFACLCTILGIVVIAMPVTVLGNNFNNAYEELYKNDDGKETQNASSNAEGDATVTSPWHNADESSLKDQKSIKPFASTSIKRTDDAITRLEVLADTLTAALAEVRAELKIQHELLRKANSSGKLL